MRPRALNVALCTAVLAAASPAAAVDIRQCAMVAEGRAEIVNFEAERADGSRVRLDGLLSTPDGAGPFPVVVMQPGSAGLVVPYCYGAVVAQLTDWGLATLVVAPTTARDGSGAPMPQYSFADLARYGHGAAAALSALPQIDPARIGLWGHSRGGHAVLEAVTRGDGPPGMFRAAVAVAPECLAKGLPSIPLLLVIGTADRVVSVDWCKDYAASVSDAAGFEFLLLADAGHAYWAPAAPDYDEAAAMLAAARLMAFLRQHALLPR